MWKDMVINKTNDYQFRNPAKQSDIEQIREAFGIELPADLKSLLSDTDGIFSEYGSALIWSASQIVRENKNIRNYEGFHDIYWSFDTLLFFSDAGNGDLFGFSIINGVIRKNDIYVWNHEDDSRKWVAPSLQKFIEWSLDGKITV